MPTSFLIFTDRPSRVAHEEIISLTKSHFTLLRLSEEVKEHSSQLGCRVRALGPGHHSSLF